MKEIIVIKKMLVCIIVISVSFPQVLLARSDDDAMAVFAAGEVARGFQNGMSTALELRALQLKQQELEQQRQQNLLDQQQRRDDAELLQDYSVTVQRDFVIEFMMKNFVNQYDSQLGWGTPHNYKLRKGGHDFFMNLAHSHPQTYQRVFRDVGDAYGEKTLDEYLTFFDLECGDMKPLKRVPIQKNK